MDFLFENSISFYIWPGCCDIVWVSGGGSDGGRYGGINK